MVQLSLSDEHRAMLEASAVNPDLFNIKTATTQDELPEEFRHLGAQAVPAMLFSYTSLSGRTTFQLRPDNPADGAKYRFPHKSVSLNVMPGSDPTSDVLIVEGTKQALAARSWTAADVTVVGMAGCRGWYLNGAPNPDLSLCRDRRVVVCLDADAASNLEVYTAGTDLQSALMIEGARSVEFIQLPGSRKAGLDDILATRESNKRTEYLQSLINSAKSKPAPAKPRAKTKPKRQLSDIATTADRQAIIVNADRWHVIGQLTEALREKWAGTRLFNRGGLFAQLRAGDIAPLDQDAFLDLIQETSVTVSADRLDGSEDTVYSFSWPDSNTLQALNSRAESFPELQQITSVPYLRLTGQLVQTPGYDKDTKTYLLPSELLEQIKVPTRPTETQVQSAVKLILEEWLGDFPFGSQSDKANALATILTPLIRNLVYLSPLCVVDGLQMGVGKNLFADCLSILATGKLADPLPYTDSEDETRKAIMSVFRSGKPMMVWDEAHSIEGPALARALTAVTYTDRILGQSRMAEFPNKVTWLALGNAVAINGDMSRRVYRVALKPEYADPQNRDARSFRHPDIRGWTSENRAELLSAALTLIVHWDLRGRPYEFNTPSFGSFEQWQHTVGGILQCAGVEGFLGGLDAWRSSTDFEGSYWAAHLEWLSEKVGFENEFTVSQIVSLLKSDPLSEMPPGVHSDVAGGLNRPIGKAYAKVNERVISGMKLCKSGMGHRKVSKWILKHESSQQTGDFGGSGGLGGNPQGYACGETRFFEDQQEKNVFPYIGENRQPSATLQPSQGSRPLSLVPAIADKLKSVPEYERLCAKCGQREQLVPPSLFWYACPNCHPPTFGGGQ